VRVAAVIVLLAGLALVPAADAALPKGGSSLEAHQHGTGGHDWHVQLEVNHTSTRLATVVLYAQECGVTVFEDKVPLAHDGSFAVDGMLPKGAGAWLVHGNFVDASHAVGIWSVTKADCVTGDRPFTAHGADGHSHGGHIVRGNPREYPPDAILGSSKNARRLRALRIASEAAKSRFDTLAKLARLGYVLDPVAATVPKPCPGTWHVRKHGAGMWGSFLDPTEPQALVYWCDSLGRWTLAAFMYRAPPTAKPPTFGGLMQWHKHADRATWMTHVWMVPDPRAAFATCVPFPAFERFSIFSYEPYTPDTHIDVPCSDVARHVLG
jgi:hypothetical protein